MKLLNNSSELLLAIHSGNIIQYCDWPENEFIYYDVDTQQVVDENGEPVNAFCLVVNRENWFDLSFDETNLTIAKKYFPNAEFGNDDDDYKLNKEFTITWTGEGEIFAVDRSYLDREVGIVTDDDIFSGDFKECLEFCLEKNISNVDAAILKRLKS